MMCAITAGEPQVSTSVEWMDGYTLKKKKKNNWLLTLIDIDILEKCSISYATHLRNIKKEPINLRSL